MYYYLAYGLVVSSELELLEIAPTANSIPAISITAGRLEPEFIDLAWEGFRWRSDTNGVFLSWDTIGTFHVSSDGTRVVYDVEESVDRAWIRLAILGPVISVAMWSRGYLVLHASASLVRDKACLFIGSGGAGKSTMVAAMHNSGFAPLCDDTVALAIDISSSEPIRSYAGIPRLKLWPDSAQSTGHSVSETEPIYTGHSKLSVVLVNDIDRRHEPYVISNIFCLTIGDQLGIDRVSKKDALLILLSNLYVSMMSKKLASKFAARDFQQCSRLLEQTDVVKLIRPEDLQLLPKVAALVDHYAATSAKADFQNQI